MCPRDAGLLLLLLSLAAAGARPATDAVASAPREVSAQHPTLVEVTSGSSHSEVTARTQVAEASGDALEGLGGGDGPVAETELEEPAVSGQQFYPSFAPLFQPLGHSRPQLLFQEPAHSQRPSSLLRPQHNSFLGYHQPPPAPATAYDAGYLRSTASGPTGPTAAAAAPASNLLGSGNFGVIRGGTFYSNDDDRGVYGGSGDTSIFGGSYYSNGHGRPSSYYNPRPQPHHHDFFANFRDFADINTPTKSSYSQYVVVYANKNATAPVTTPVGRPNNIIEQLALLDSEPTPTTGPVKKKKKPLKPVKTKEAAQWRVDKEAKQQQGPKKALVGSSSPQKDAYEPLLALS